MASKGSRVARATVYGTAAKLLPLRYKENSAMPCFALTCVQSCVGMLGEGLLVGSRSLGDFAGFWHTLHSFR